MLGPVGPGAVAASVLGLMAIWALHGGASRPGAALAAMGAGGSGFSRDEAMAVGWVGSRLKPLPPGPGATFTLKPPTMTKAAGYVRWMMEGAG